MAVQHSVAGWFPPRQQDCRHSTVKQDCFGPFVCCHVWHDWEMRDEKLVNGIMVYLIVPC